MVQILCNKKYSCPKTESNDSSNFESDSDTEISKHKKKTRKKSNIQTSITMSKIKKEPNSTQEEPSEHIVIFNEPTFDQTSTLKKNQSNQTTFDAPSNSLLSPSFNLKSNMKSTPIHSCHNCNNPCLQSNSNLKKNPAPENVFDTIADVHAMPNTNVTEIQTDTSFHSC